MTESSVLSAVRVFVSWRLSSVVLGGVSVACGGGADTVATAGWAITSPAFKDAEKIPSEYTCDGRAFPVALTNPQLDWTDGPTGTQSYAIVAKHLAIVEGLPPTDPNYFKGFMWAIWNIPGTVHSLPANLSRDEFPAQIPGAQQWSIRNQYGYFAPCPNADPAPVTADPATRVTERYGFSIYALNTASVTLPPKEADVGNYTWTMTKYLDAVNIGTTTLNAVSDAVAGTAPVPVDMAALMYPVPVP